MKKQIPPLKQRMPCLNPIYPPDDQLFLDIKKRIQRQDYSSQTNQLIQKLLTHGQTNYTCWVVKKWIYYAGNTTIKHEDEFSRQVLEQNIKNFQLWDYRNFIYDVTKDHQSQYALMDKILESSPKNYHVWSNRVRLVGIVKNYKEQIQKTQKFIHRDVYNNSAWTYRAFCFQNLPVKDFQAQFQFLFSTITKNIDNQAAWNYLRGYFPCYRLSTLPFGTVKKNLLNYSDYPKIKQFCQSIIQNKQINEHLKIQTLITLLIIHSQNQQNVQFAKEICSYLSELEPLRVNYYGWLRNAL